MYIWYILALVSFVLSYMPVEYTHWHAQPLRTTAPSTSFHDYDYVASWYQVRSKCGFFITMIPDPLCDSRGHVRIQCSVERCSRTTSAHVCTCLVPKDGYYTVMNSVQLCPVRHFCTGGVALRCDAGSYPVDKEGAWTSAGGVACRSCDGLSWCDGDAVVGQGKVQMAVNAETEVDMGPARSFGTNRRVSIRDNFTCPAGTYPANENGNYVSPSAGYASVCAECPYDSICDGVSAPLLASATQCPTGKYFSETIQDCVDCPANTTSTTNGLACEAEPGYYYSHPSDTATQCPVGTACPGATAEPVECNNQVGEYADTAGSTTCQICQAGSYAPSGQSCLPCHPGTFSTMPTSRCSVCHTGSAQAGSGATECTPCGAGEVAGEGATECTKCTEDSIMNSTSSACVQCEEGTVPNEFRTLCVDCTGRDIESEDVPGTCTPCPPDLLPNSSHTECIACPKYTSLVLSSYCMPNDGFYWLDEAAMRLEACPAGAFCKEGIMTRCTGSGYQPAAQQSACLTCGAGSYTTSAGASFGNTACVPCPHGYYCLGDGAAAPCPDGTTSGQSLGQDNSGAAQCTALPGYYTENNIVKECTPGYRCAGGSTYREACTKGTYQPLAGQHSCLVCPIDYYTTKNGVAAESAAVSCDVCPVGHACPGNGAARVCWGIQYQPQPGQHRCLECVPGSYTSGPSMIDDYNTACAACPAAHACPEGSRAIKVCTDNTYSKPGATECTVCNAARPDYLSPDHRPPYDCSYCPVPSFYDPVSGTCTLCNTLYGLEYCESVTDANLGVAFLQRATCPSSGYYRADARTCRACLEDEVCENGQLRWEFKNTFDTRTKSGKIMASIVSICVILCAGGIGVGVYFILRARKAKLARTQGAALANTMIGD